MKVLFAQTAHPLKDDRVWYHQRSALLAQGDEVEICTTWGHSSWWRKASMIRRSIRRYSPDIVVADTPFAVLVSGMWCKVVWDITEFYPSKKDLSGGCVQRGLMRAIKKRIGKLAAKKCAGMLYGEQEKIAPYLPTSLPRLCVPYYPSQVYVPYQPARTLGPSVRILYAGPKTKDKGWDNVQEVVRMCREKMPQVEWQLEVVQGVEFEEFCRRLSDYDLFLDLRQIDEENTQCLPIKLFYYMAAGRPSVYSKLSAITRAIPEIESCVSLVNPTDYSQVADTIIRYAMDADYYRERAMKARQLYLSTCTWEMVAPRMCQFIHADNATRGSHVGSK